MKDDRIAQLKTAAGMLRDERRKYNNILKKIIDGELKEYNGEDLVRLVGTLEAAYNHCLASVAADGDIFCLAKHISYAIILCGELEQPDVEPLYDILAIITDGRVEACAACKQEERSANGDTKQSN